MNMALTAEKVQMSPSELADVFGQLISEARETAAVAKTAIGSEEELEAIEMFVRNREPALAEDFRDWCVYRAQHVSGATRNGVHVLASTYRVEYSRKGIFVSEMTN